MWDDRNNHDLWKLQHFISGFIHWTNAGSVRWAETSKDHAEDAMARIMHRLREKQQEEDEKQLELL